MPYARQENTHPECMRVLLAGVRALSAERHKAREFENASRDEGTLHQTWLGRQDLLVHSLEGERLFEHYEKVAIDH